MASFDPLAPYSPDIPPPRPTTPPVRRGFLRVLAVLCLLIIPVYGIPYVAERVGYSYESGRARADMEALAKLDESGIINKSSLLFRMAADAVSPAVVNIRGLRTLAPRDLTLEGASRLGSGRIEVSSGSGVVIDTAQGWIVTNHHVVKDADELIIRVKSGSEYPAQLVGSDPKTDLAVLRASAPLQTAARWGDSEKLEVGEWVLAIGSPYMLDQTVTAGIVSATRRNNLPSFDSSMYQDFVQTDAAVNPGNSGGPLIDLRGKVVGINTAIFSPQGQEGGNVGIGLAISSSMARRVVEQLTRKGRVTRGYLGVGFDPLTAGLAGQLGLPPEVNGVVLNFVEPGGPSARAGLRPGDVVVGLAGQPIADMADLRLRVANLEAGKTVPVRVYREGELETLSVTVSEWPVLAELGAQLRDLPPDLAARFPGRPDRAVIVIGVEPNSPAHRARLLPGLRVLSVAKVPVSTVAEAHAAAAKANDSGAGIPLRVQTLEGREAEITLVGPAARP